MAVAWAVVATLVIWSPRIALACPVCMAGRDDESRTAFVIATAFMTFMPFLLIGGAIAWLWRRMAQREQDHQEAKSANSRSAKAA